MEIKTAGKVALITGGVQGIGLEVASQLAKSGAKLVLADINEAAGRDAINILRELTADVHFVRTDLGSAESVSAMVKEVMSHFSRIDFFVNCAAVLDDKTFEESCSKDWQKMFNICLLGPMHCLSHILPIMREQGYGRIVCFSSDSARIGQARLSYYAAAKAGITALIKSIAQEIGSDGITANVISPGATNTPLRMKREQALRAQMGEEKYAKRTKTVQRMYPLRRIGEPSDIAPMVVFLLSDHASWITGQVISINGGFTMV